MDETEAAVERVMAEVDEDWATCKGEKEEYRDRYLHERVCVPAQQKLQAAIRREVRAARIRALTEVADSMAYKLGCACHSCTPLRRLLAEAQKEEQDA